MSKSFPGFLPPPQVIAEQLGVEKDKVTREATLTELGADSLDIVESVMALEEEFDIELPDEEKGLFCIENGVFLKREAGDVWDVWGWIWVTLWFPWGLGHVSSHDCFQIASSWLTKKNH